MWPFRSKARDDAAYWRNCYETLVAQTGRDLNDGLGRDATAQLAAAWHELSCCDDINLSGSLADGISELQTDRERLRALVADAGVSE